MCHAKQSAENCTLCRNNIKMFSQCTSSLPHGPAIRLVTLMVLLLAWFILLNFINCLTVGLPLRRDGIKGQDGKTGKDYDPRDTSKLTLGVVRGPVFALGISVSLNPAVSLIFVFLRSNTKVSSCSCSRFSLIIYEATIGWAVFQKSIHFLFPPSPPELVL